ncbi:PAS domain S-box protein [Litoribacter populi]|uniref:PAS domain S-box protein n=1 Tax=Litoribacter populi TaxID=2598460 RepID=UPI00163D6289|nr:PAS domain S-box protein [Litoribacter populi]
MDTIYQDIFYHSSTPSAILDINSPDFTIIDVNAAFLEGAMATREMVIGKKVHDAFPDLGKETSKGPHPHLKYFDAVLEAKAAQKMPILKYDIINHYTGEKEERYWEATNTPMFNEKGEIVRILQTVFDVTAHVEDVLAKGQKSSGLEDADSKFRNIFDLSSVGIGLVDLDGNWVEVNPKLCEILGYSRWEILRKNYQEMTHPQDLEASLEAHTKLLQGDMEVYKTEKRFFKKGGETVWAYISVALVRNKLGEPFHFVAHIMDITEKKKIEIALEESEQRYHSLFLHHPDPVYSFDTQGKFVNANAATINLTESSYRSLMGTYFLPLFPLEDTRRVYENFLKASEGKSVNFNTGFVSTRGTKRILNITHLPIYTNGDIVGVFGIAKDITEAVKAEQAVSKAKNQLENLVSTIDGIVWETTQDLTVNFISPQTTEILGYNPEDWYNNPEFWKKNIHEKDRQNFTQQLQAGLEKGGNFDFEFRMYDIQGNLVWFRNMVTVIKAKGQPVILRGIMTNISAAKQAEQALEANEAKLSKILERSLDVICTVDDRGKFRDVSKASEKVWGYQPEEMMGRPIYDFIAPEDHAKTQTIGERIRTGKDVTFFENRYIHKDGHLVPVNWTVNYDREEKLMFAVASDITIRKKAEEELKLSERRFKNLVQNGADIVGIIDMEARYKYISANVEGIVGFTQEEMIGELGLPYVYPDDLQEVQEALVEISQKKIIKAPHYRFVTKGGNYIWLEVVFTNHLDDPAINGVVFNARDITDKKEAEIQMELSERRFKNLVQNGADIVSILDPQANFLYISPNVEVVIGFTSEELEGRESFIIIHPDDIQIALQALEEIKVKNHIKLPPMRFAHKDGSYIWVETVATNRLNDPSINGIVTNSRDITEKVKADEELRLSEQRHKFMFNLSPIPKWVFDPETLKFLDVNQTAINTYGYSKEEFLSMTIRDIRPQDDLPKLHNALTNSIPQSGTIRFGTHTHQKKDGSFIQVEVYGYEFDLFGDKGVMAVAVDVTEREKALSKLKDSQTKLQTAQEMAEMGYFQIDLEQQKLFLTGGVFHIWETTEGPDKDADWFFSTAHPEDGQYIKETLEYAVEHDEILDAEYRIIMPDGRIKWIHELGKVGYDDKGNKVFFEGTVQDITERKSAEAAIHETNQRYELVTQATSDAIWDWDIVNGKIEYGDSFYKIFDYNADTFRKDNQGYLEKVHPEDLERVAQSLEGFLHSGLLTWEEEYRYQKRNGEYVQVLDRGIVVRDADGNPLRFVGALQDISQVKRIEKEDQLRISLSGIFSEKSTPTEALGAVVRGLLEFTELDYGEFWAPPVSGENKLYLEAYEGDYEENPGGYPKKFEKETCIQGLAWKRREVVELSDLATNPHFYRKDFAKANGLTSAIAYPVKSSEDIIAVIILFAKKQHHDFQESLSLSPIILDQLASNFIRKRTENELNSFFDLSGDILVIAGFDGYFKKMNKAVSNVLGYTVEETLGIPFMEVVHPEDREKTTAALAKLQTGQTLSYFENRLLNKNKEEVWMSWTATPLVEENLMIAIARDISERKQYERELEASNQRVKQTLESIQDAFFEVDENWIVTYWNNKAEQVLFRKKEEVMGTNLWESFPEAVELQFYTEYHLVMGDRLARSFDEYFPPTKAWYDVTAYPSGKGITVYFRDITERKNLELELIEFKKNGENK